MRRAYQQGAFATALVAGLAMAGSALAQMPPQAGRIPPDHVQFAPTRAPVPQDDATNRQAEIVVELAWLSDASVFPCNLGARVENGQLKVWGFVPTAAVKQTALRLAHHFGGLPIIDGLRVHSQMVELTRGSLTTQEMNSTAQSLLQIACPNQADAVQVQCRQDGSITLAGLVPNWEDRLACSRCLRRLPGCTGVLNELQVTGGFVQDRTLALNKMNLTPPAPPAYVQRSAPLPGEPGAFGIRDSKKLEGAPVASAPASPANVTTPWKTPDLPKSTSVAALPANPDAPKRLDPNKIMGPATPVAAMPAKDTHVAAPGKDYSPPPPPVLISQGKLVMPNDAALVRRVNFEPKAGDKEFSIADLDKRLDGSECVTPKNKTPEQFAQSLAPAPLPDLALPKEPGARSQETGVKGDQASKLPPVPTPVTAAPTLVPLPPMAPTDTAKFPLVARPAVTASSPPLRADNAKPAQAAKAYESQGLVILSDAEDAVATPPVKNQPARKLPPPTSELRNRLRQAVDAACDKHAHNVDVVFRNAGEVNVALTAPNETTGAEYARRILAMPELAMYKVELEIKLAQ